MIAKVVVENAAYSFDIAFSYKVPQQYVEHICAGCRVMVPFGRANRSRQGMVVEIVSEDDNDEKIKSINQLIDDQPLLDKEQLGLMEWLHKRTFCTYYDALRAIIPSGLTVKVKVMCSLSDTPIQMQTNPTQEKIISYLREQKKPVEFTKLLGEIDVGRSSQDIKELINNGAILLSEDIKEKSSDGKLVVVQLCKDHERVMEKENLHMTPTRKNNRSAPAKRFGFVKGALLLRGNYQTDGGQAGKSRCCRLFWQADIPQPLCGPPRR